jgi:hypothetical protein|uniref:Uncharacterized protein n=1 Tax=Leviviridae sp. TaxID=2027243 RepID=A0A514D382_9VIRU|nr:MAG: hypothetical protein H3Bulk41347_000004 [Leviviridae sp.]
MSQKDLFNQPLDVMKAESPFSEQTLNWVLTELGSSQGPGNRALLRQVVKLAIRLYILRSIAGVKPEKMQDLIDAVTSETLGHTRAD